MCQPGSRRRRPGLIDRASAETGVPPGVPECELVVKAHLGGLERGFLYLADEGVFRPDQHGLPDLTDARLRTLADRTELTYTCVPPGSGVRMALDADLDGCYDATEIRAGHDPRDPASRPADCG